MRERPIVAIDGPVGAGKSTVARALARALGFSYLNTGAMYRAVAVAARAAGISPAADGGETASAPHTDAALTENRASDAGDESGTAGDAQAGADLNATSGEHLGKILDTLSITFIGERIMLAGHDITDIIKQPEIGDLASRFSAIGLVRDKMRDLQRAAGAAGGVVMEGRDIGTAIFPDAEVKFFLVADPAVRAARRYAELVEKGVATTLEEVTAQMAERDRRDAGRALAPLKQADDAIVIDSSGRDVESVVNEMKSKVEAVSRAIKGLKRA
jgi:CMP/dCMP kinase